MQMYNLSLVPMIFKMSEYNIVINIMIFVIFSNYTKLQTV